jgi:predicted esterase
LQQHTIYMPSNPGDASLPVFVWGNGGCGADGLANVQLLQQIASYGYLAISSGGPGQQGGTTAQMMTDSINWAVQNAGQGAYANVDASKIMAAGFSCGGVEAYAQIWDSRVATIGIFSSGLLENQTAATHFDKPILYALGGTGDIAYANVGFQLFTLIQRANC